MTTPIRLASLLALAIAAGCRADLVAMGDDFQLRASWIGGKRS